MLQRLSPHPNLFENHLTENRCFEEKQQNPAISVLFVWNRPQETVGKTCLKHLALQDSKKPNQLRLHSEEKDPQPQGCQQHNWSPEDCFIAWLVLHLYRDEVAGVPQAGNGGIISFTFF